MQIVIDIPEDYYNFVKKQVADGITNPLKMRIAKGTPLPKGHGRLIDANKLCEGRVSNDTVVIVAKCAPTIIEADGGDAE